MGTIQQRHLQIFKGLRTNPRWEAQLLCHATSEAKLTWRLGSVPPFTLQTKKTTKTQQKESNTFEKQLKTLKKRHLTNQHKIHQLYIIYVYIYINIFKFRVNVSAVVFFFCGGFTSSFHGLETFQGPWLWYSRWVPLRPGKDDRVS